MTQPADVPLIGLQRFNQFEFQDATTISDVSAGGSVGAADVTVDLARPIRINQTTSAKDLTLAAPTRGLPMLQPVENVGTAGFWMYGRYIRPGGCHIFIYDATLAAWRRTASSPQIIAQDYGNPVTAPANDTNDNTLASVSFPGGVIGANGRVWAYCSFTNTVSANAKTFRMKIGSTTLCQFPSTSTSGTLDTQWRFANKNDQAAQIGLPTNSGGTGTTTQTAANTATVDTSAAWTLNITAQKATGSETVVLTGYTIVVERFD